VYNLLKKHIHEDFWQEVLFDTPFYYLNDPLATQMLLNGESDNPHDYFHLLYELTVMLFEYSEANEMWAQDNDAAITELEAEIAALKNNRQRPETI
jgi:hypothetical protein